MKEIDGRFANILDTHIAQAARSSGEMICFASSIGPDEALEILSRTAGNRSESKPTVDMYARDMAGGNWVEEDNTNPISFSINGKLINGHHRMRAVVRAGIRVRFFFTFGSSIHAMRCVDGGRPRTIADRLRIAGEPITPKVIASLRICGAIARGGASQINFKASIEEVRALFVEHQEAVNAYAPNIRNYPASFWGSAMFLRPTDPLLVDSIVGDILHGEGATGPTLLLRDFLLKNRGRSASVTAAQVVYKTLTAIRAVILGRSTTRLAVIDSEKVVQWANDMRRGIAA